MNMSLKDWLKSGWLTEHKTSPQEIGDLLKVTDRNLADCQVSGLSADGRFGIAYNAALQAATAALAASGYRASRESHHYRVIQSLAYTIEADQDLIHRFDRFRKKRNIGGYERIGAVSDMEADEMIYLAKSLRKEVEQWLYKCHPDLMK
jgi:hypothetical protein